MSTEYRHALVEDFLHVSRLYIGLNSFPLRYYYQMAILNPYPTDEEFMHNAHLLSEKLALRKKT